MRGYNKKGVSDLQDKYKIIKMFDRENTCIEGKNQKTAVSSELSELLNILKAYTAGALNRPISMLFKLPERELSASEFLLGKEELESYYATILSLQESRLRPLQQFIDKFILHKYINKTLIRFDYKNINPLNAT